ncbi:hypothetical protein OSTOST_25533 [Ostertagia ostertagi]
MVASLGAVGTTFTGLHYRMTRTTMGPVPTDAEGNVVNPHGQLTRRTSDMRAAEVTGGLLFDFTLAPDYDFSAAFSGRRNSSSSGTRAPAHPSDTNHNLDPPPQRLAFPDRAKEPSRKTSGKPSVRPSAELPRSSGSLIDTYSPTRTSPRPSSFPVPSASFQRLTLTTPRSPVDDISTTSSSSNSRRRADAFTAYRDVPSSSRHPPPSPPDDPAEIAAPAKRPRLVERAEPRLPIQGIQPHPAHSPRWNVTPPRYRNEVSHLHPWGSHIDPRPNFTGLTEETVTAEAPLHVYRQIPSQGYMSAPFPNSARRRMAKLFAMASAALAAQATMADDRTTHHVIATVPSLASIPVHLELQLPAMSSEGGWARSRPADIWIVDSNLVLRTRVADAFFSASGRTVNVELLSEARTHNALRNAVRRFGFVDEDTNRASIPLCVRLGRIPSGTDPTFEFLASDDLAALLRPSRQTIAHSIMDAEEAEPYKRRREEREREESTAEPWRNPRRDARVLPSLSLRQASAHTFYCCSTHYLYSVLIVTLCHCSG